MPFKPATKEVGFAKGSFFGPGGTGKSTLLAMILMYLSKTYHNSAPVAWLASEKGVDFIIDMFAAEKVPLLLQRTRSFLDLRSASREALQEGACAIGVDCITHFWDELFDEGMNGKNATGPRLSRIGKIKSEWAPFAQDFQDSPIHFLVTGRMGFVWDEVEIQDDKGKWEKEMSKGDTKIKAEGDFGHEPDLVVETAKMDDPDFVRFEKVRGRARKTFKSQMLHVATVKKCRVWALNGQAFTWKDQPGYKLGYYETVAKPFIPYFQAINIGGGHHVADNSRPKSDVLFDRGSDASYFEAQQKRVIALEKWEATMNIIAGGQTKDNIRKRAIIGETITGTRSRTEFERQSLDTLIRSMDVLLALEKRLKTDSPTTDDELRSVIAMATQDVDHPGKSGTLLEMMLKKSVESVKLAADGNAQAVVHIMDHAQSMPF